MRRWRGRRAVLALCSFAAVALVLVALVWFTHESGERNQLPEEPSTEAMAGIVGSWGRGGLRSADWDDVAVGEWDTRTLTVTVPPPALSSAMADFAARIDRAHRSSLGRGGAGLPGGYGKLIVEPWQADLKKVIARVVWHPTDAEEQVREEMFYLYRASNADGRGIERGAALFGATCSGCHGIAAGGIDGVAPPLSGRALFTTRLAEAGYTGTLESFVLGAVSAGRPLPNGAYGAVMAAYAEEAGGPLRADQVRDVVAFVLNGEETALGGSTLPWPAPTGGAAGGDAAASMPVALGKIVYQGQDCLGCHGWPGDGGVTGPDLAGIATAATSRMPGLTAEQYLRVAILGPSATIAPGCPPGPCPDMMPRTYGDSLSQLELDTLVRYMLSLEAPPSGSDAPGGDAPEPAPIPTRTPDTVAGAARAPEGTPDTVADSGRVPTGTMNPTSEAGRPQSRLPDPRAEAARLPTRTPDPTADAALLARGAELYRQHCQGCHGDRGQGRYSTDLEAVRRSVRPVSYARASIADGVPGTTMPGWVVSVGGPLAGSDLDAVASHVVDLVDHR